jgi:hypothetical protein
VEGWRRGRVEGWRGGGEVPAVSTDGWVAEADRLGTIIEARGVVRSFGQMRRDRRGRGAEWPRNESG